MKGHTDYVCEINEIKENNLISCGCLEIIIWNMINGDKLNEFKLGPLFGSLCLPVKILESIYFSNNSIYETNDV